MNSISIWIMFLSMLSLAVTIPNATCGSLEFQDDRPLQLTWDQVKSGTDVVVCNYGNTTISSFKVAFDDFNFQLNATPIADEKILTVLSNNPSIEALNCSNIKLKAIEGLAEESVPDPGKYNGQIVIYGKDIDAIRKNIQIDIKALECALDLLTLNVTRFPISGTLNITRIIPISVSSKFEVDNPYIPIKNKIGYMPKLPENGLYLGFIQHDGRFGEISVKNEQYIEKEGVTLIPIRIDGLQETGSYSGKLYLAGINNNISITPINVRVTDHVLFPSIAILVGVLIPLGVIFLQQRLTLLWRFKERKIDIKAKYEDAQKDLHKKYPSFELKYGKLTDKNSNQFDLYKRPNNNNIEAYQGAVQRALDNYTQDKWLLDPNNKEFKKVIKMLEDAENDVAIMGASDEEGLGASLRKLNDDVNDLTKFIGDEYPTPSQPSILISALGILQGRELQVGEARKIKEKARGHSDLIKKWIEMVTRVKRYYLWVTLLSYVNMDQKPKNYETDYDKLRKSAYKIVEVEKELLEINSIEALEEKGVDKDLKTVYSQLSYLGSKYNCWVPMEEKKDVWAPLYQSTIYTIPEKIPITATTFMVHFSHLMPGTDKEIMKPTISWLDSQAIAQNPAESFERVEILRAKRFLGDGGVILVSLFIALLIGLSQLYFGKTFGSWQDYAAAILLGSTTETLLNGIKGVIKQRDIPLQGEDESSDAKKK